MTPPGQTPRPQNLEAQIEEYGKLRDTLRSSYDRAVQEEDEALENVEVWRRKISSTLQELTDNRVARARKHRITLRERKNVGVHKKQFLEERAEHYREQHERKELVHFYMGMLKQARTDLRIVQWRIRTTKDQKEDIEQRYNGLVRQQEYWGEGEREEEEEERWNGDIWLVSPMR